MGGGGGRGMGCAGCMEGMGGIVEVEVKEDE